MTPPAGAAAVYGLDIETDTTTDGLDPMVGPVTAVAVSAADGDVVFTGPEVQLLRRLDDHLRSLPPGVLTTWNGGRFDVPYLARRAELACVPLGLRVLHDPSLTRVHADDRPGRTAGAIRADAETGDTAGQPGDRAENLGGGWRAAWYDHLHLDLYPAYRGDVGRLLGVSCGLKRIARLAGLQPIEVDPTSIHRLDDAALREYVASDARCTRQLALRRWPTVLRAADPVPPHTYVA